MQEPAITPTLLAAAGVNIPEDQLADMLDHLNAELEERIGESITESLDDDMLEALVDLQQNGTDEDVSNWLQANVPDLEQIIQDETDILMGEIAENAKELSQES